MAVAKRKPPALASGLIFAISLFLLLFSVSFEN